MRDASGNLVEVRVREPWALHLLTSDGTNCPADAVDDTEAMKAPAEPGLVPLTPVGVEMLIERLCPLDRGEGEKPVLRRLTQAVRRRSDAVFSEHRSHGQGDQHCTACVNVRECD